MILCNCGCINVSVGKLPAGQVRLLQQSEDEQEADGEEEDDEDEYGGKTDEWRRVGGTDALRRRGVGEAEEDT